MIQDINGKTLTNPLEKVPIEIHWQEYAQYQAETSLSDFSVEELIEKISEIKKQTNPVIDSAVLIADLLTDFGKKYEFHRRFNEIFPHLQSGRILGMQLYILLLNDSEQWVFHKTKKNDHLYSNSTYFLTSKK